MEATPSSETLETACKTTQPHDLEYYNHLLYRHENIKPQKVNYNYIGDNKSTVFVGFNISRIETGGKMLSVIQKHFLLDQGW
jgi:hypothetical protein